jgi:hypothetical protein
MYKKVRIKKKPVPVEHEPLNTKLETIPEHDDKSSDISDEIDFEEEVRKLIGIRNATQTPQYISKKNTNTNKQKDVVIGFTESLPNKSCYVADKASVCRGSIPVGRRNSGTPSSRD